VLVAVPDVLIGGAHGLIGAAPVAAIAG